MKKENKFFTTRNIGEIAIFTALAFGLDFLQGGIFKGVFPNGGSIGIAMLPILVLAYRRGFTSSLVCATLLAFLQCFGGVYAISSSWYNVLFQILLDYILAYPVVAIAGLFYKPFKKAETKKEQTKYLIIGSVLGGVAKFLTHFLSGFIFWANYDFAGGPVVYSIVYNGSYMLPNTILCTIILVLINLKAHNIFVVKENNKENEGELIHE